MFGDWQGLKAMVGVEFVGGGLDGPVIRFFIFDTQDILLLIERNAGHGLAAGRDG